MSTTRPSISRKRARRIHEMEFQRQIVSEPRRRVRNMTSWNRSISKRRLLVIWSLVARPSRDVIVAGHQQTTQDWWTNRRSAFECFVSQVVIREAALGDPTEA